MIWTMLSASLALLLGAALPAWSQEPSATVDGFLCEIDLAVCTTTGTCLLDGSECTSDAECTATCDDGTCSFDGTTCKVDADCVTSVFTFDSREHCTGSNPAENINVDCTATIPGWDLGSSTNPDVTCEIDRRPCGENGTVFVPVDDGNPTGSSSLNINTNGVANLNCRYNP